MTAIPPTLRKTSISIDSRFADQYFNGTADFMIRLPSTMRNVGRIELTSAEVPQVAYVFSAAAGNTSFFVDISGVRQNLVLPDGNYTPTQLNTALNALALPAGITFAYNGITNRFSVTNTGTSVALTLTSSPSTAARYWGIGYWLGFRTQTFVVATGATVVGTAAPLTLPPSYALVQLQCPDMLENTIHRTEDRSFVPALGKIVLRSGSYTVAYDDAANLLLKENVFARPTALTQLRFTLVDAYGKLVLMGDTDWSLTVEVTEIINPVGAL
jgi:hypothetical protein